MLTALGSKLGDGDLIDFHTCTFMLQKMFISFCCLLLLIAIRQKSLIILLLGCCKQC